MKVVLIQVVKYENSCHAASLEEKKEGVWTNFSHRRDTTLRWNAN